MSSLYKGDHMSKKLLPSILVISIVAVLLLAGCAKPAAKTTPTKTTTTPTTAESGDVSKEVADADKLNTELTSDIDSVDEDLALLQNI